MQNRRDDEGIEARTAKAKRDCQPDAHLGGKKVMLPSKLNPTSTKYVTTAVIQREAET